jgi:hypothetical protein
MLRRQRHLNVRSVLRAFLPVLLPLFLGLAGCEFGTHPIIIDGSVATAQFPVNADIPSFLPPSFTVEDSIDLAPVYGDAAEVDSIRFYNLTFIAEGDSAGLAIRVTGSITVDGVPCLNFDNVPLSVFSPERSIFAPAAGFSYEQAGVARIRQALAPGAADTKLNMRGSFQADGRSLHFTLQAKLYTQVFLRGVN